MKKRQCNLCEHGTIVTSVPKDKAVCQDCARVLMEQNDSPCSHVCGCECHDPGALILHFMPCCYGGCPECGIDIRFEADVLKEHTDVCHTSLHEIQGTLPAERTP